MKIRSVHIFFVFIILAFLSQTDLFAVDTRPAFNTRVGVGPVECFDCSNETKDAMNRLRNGINERLTKSLVINVVPIEDMDKAVASTTRKTSEPISLWAQRIGVAAGADKVVYVSITEKPKKYVTDTIPVFSINVSVIDVKSGIIEIKEPTGTDRIEDFNAIADNAGDAVSRVYHANPDISEKTDASVTFSYLYPQADLRDKGAGNGYGVSVNVYFTEPVWFLFTGGVFYFDTPTKNIMYLYMFPFGIHLPFYYSVSYSFKIIPSIGAGGLVSQMRFDYYTQRLSGDYDYHTEFFFNPLVTGRIEFNYFMATRYAVVATPSISMVIGNENRMGYIFSFDLGIKIRF